MKVTGDKYLADGWTSFERSCSQHEATEITERAYELSRTRDKNPEVAANLGPAAPTAEEWLAAANHVLGRVHCPGVATRGNVNITSVSGSGSGGWPLPAECASGKVPTSKSPP
jgi:hypothetical protein